MTPITGREGKEEYSGVEPAYHMSWMTRFLVRRLQRMRPVAGRQPDHLALAERGETEACFHLQQLGYRIVATNFRASHDRGEIDLIGWDGETLCFVEVKTRTDDSFAPPSTAVTADKRQHVLSVAKRYLRHLSRKPPCRFDILSVVPSPSGELQFSLQKDAFTWDSRRSRERSFRDFKDNRSSRFRWH